MALMENIGLSENKGAYYTCTKVSGFLAQHSSPSQLMCQETMVYVGGHGLHSPSRGGRGGDGMIGAPRNSTHPHPNCPLASLPPLKGEVTGFSPCQRFLRLTECHEVQGFF